MRSDSFFVDVIALWCKIFCNGDLYCAAVGKRLDGLHYAFSVSRCSHDRSNTVVFHCSRKNL